MSENHILYSQHNPRFKLSSYTQETLCWVGQECVFDKASEALEKLCHLQISDKQVERVCHYYGGLLEQEMLEDIATGTVNQDTEVQEETYVMLDGAQFFFREEGWKEVKLGRLFSANNHLPESAQRNWVRDSTYVVHKGSSDVFLEKLSFYIDSLKETVFIADGAPWIWRWVDAFYPERVQILDFYHAVEHLASFGKCHFKENNEYHTFLTTTKEKLLNDGIAEVIMELEAMKPSTKTGKEELRKLLNYFRQHQKRMYYKTFKDKGYFIGSGAIEAAHRHVLQQRLKLSGQRWTEQGFQAVANLRACYKSKQQCKIKEWALTGAA